MRARGLSTRSLGDAVGVSNGTVAGWTRGAQPRPDVAKRLADHFGLAVATLLDDTVALPADPWQEVQERYSSAAILAETVAGPAGSPGAQHVYEAKLYRGAWEREVREAAHALRSHAAALLTMAERLEAPFAGQGTEREAEAAKAFAEARATLDRAAEIEQGRRRSTHQSREKSG